MKILTLLYLIITVFTIKSSETFIKPVPYDDLLSTPESSIMKIGSDVTSIPKLEVQNKLKKKFLEIPEFKKIDTLIANSKYKFNPKFRSFSEKNTKLAKSFEKFAREDESPTIVAHKKIVELPEVEAETKSETLENVNKELQEEELSPDFTETPDYDIPDLNTIKYQTNANKIPELHEFESKLMTQRKKYDQQTNNDDDSFFAKNDDDFVLVKDNDFKDLTIKLLKAGMTKRAIDDKTSGIVNNEKTGQENVQQVNTGVDFKKKSFIEKIQNESSAEKAERLNRALEKMMRVVTVFGQVDNFLTTRTRDVIKKLALMYEYDEKQSQNRRKRYYFDD